MPRISVAQLFEDNRDRLRLAWIAGRDGGVKELDPGNLKDSHEGLIGHLNFIHPTVLNEFDDFLNIREFHEGS